MDRNQRYRFETVWALAITVVLLAAACTGSRRAVPESHSVINADPCSAPDMRGLVSTFIDAFNTGNNRRLDTLWASGNQGFVWYTVGPPKAAPNARDRNSLLAYFAARHSEHERLTMKSFTYNGAGAGNFGNFQFTVGRQADDLRSLTYSGKGAAFCRAGPGQMFVWAMTSS